MSYIWKEKEIYCTECGKKIRLTPEYMYKTRKGYQCSYTCYRKAGGDSGKYSKSKLFW